jgi:uncharacterized membrane protein YsdA (DUF1294 family)
MIAILLIAVGALESAAFALFAHDKARAQAGGWRIPERTLLLAALWGGAGAWLACVLLRHKTRKQPFRTRLDLVLILHLAVVAGVVWIIVQME